MRDNNPERHGAWLPLDIYKEVRPFIEKLVEKEDRAMTYDELADWLFDLMGPKRVLSRAQIGGHIARSKKLARFKVGNTCYVVTQKKFDRLLCPGGV
jgi:hypothetical protein